MPFYPDAKTFYAVMNDLFSRAARDPKLLQPLGKERLVLQMLVSQPDAVLVMDTQSSPPRFTTGTPVAHADIGLRLAADTLHDVWFGKIRLRDAVMTGAIKLDGSPLRALGLVGSLTDLFRFVEGIYPEMLRERGLS